LARYIGSVCRICRRENEKLFLKGDRCYSDKCGFDRRSYAPGEQGQRRKGKYSDYGIQLREKQKVKRMYGLSEKQFRLFFRRAEQQKGITGTHLLIPMERRLDNVLYSLGFVSSRSQGRQLARHNHITVNGKKVNIPTYLIKQGDVVEIREKSRNIQAFNEALDAVVRRGLPQWLELEKQNYKGIVKAYPVREDITTPIQEQQIVELYSK